MCKHCSRLVEDKADAPLVHDFMEMLATKTNRKLREDGYINAVTADDIDLEIRVTGITWNENRNDPEGMIRILSEFGSGK